MSDYSAAIAVLESRIGACSYGRVHSLRSIHSSVARTTPWVPTRNVAIDIRGVISPSGRFPRRPHGLPRGPSASR